MNLILIVLHVIQHMTKQGSFRPLMSLIEVIVPPKQITNFHHIFAWKDDTVHSKFQVKICRKIEHNLQILVSLLLHVC